jgi:hypothetical protein
MDYTPKTTYAALIDEVFHLADFYEISFEDALALQKNMIASIAALPAYRKSRSPVISFYHPNPKN